jgi:hypothetical protein
MDFSWMTTVVKSDSISSRIGLSGFFGCGQHVSDYRYGSHGFRTVDYANLLLGILADPA